VITSKDLATIRSRKAAPAKIALPATLLAIDPSMTACGWALLRDGAIQNASVVCPDRTESLVIRATVLLNNLDLLLSDIDPDAVVIEIPSGHVGRKRHLGGGAGLTTYGFAVGWICHGLADLCERRRLFHITETEWTRGRSKESRLVDLGLIWPPYRKLKDAGGDAGDAACLGLWFCDMIRAGRKVGQ
jgi:hypothetical protein